MASFCTSCGAPIEEGNAFCTTCGAAIDPTDSDPALSGANGSGSQTAAGANPTMTIPASEVVPAGAPAPGPAVSTPPYAAATPTPYTPAPSTQPMQPTTMPPAAYTAQTGTPPNDNKKTWIIVAIAALVVIAVAATVLVMTLMGGAQKRHVTFEAAGGTPVAASDVASGTSINEPAAPTRTDYRFDGWYLDSTYTSKVTFPYAVNEDTVMYAKWVENKTSQTSDSAAQQATGGTTGGTTAAPTNSSSTTTITVTGSDGTTRTETIRRSGSSQRVFPNSNSSYLSQSEVNQLSDAEKCIAWNEIIAASNGYSFKNSGLRTYFNSCSWYRANPNAASGGSLSGAAQANVDMLQRSCSSWWLHLQMS